MKWLSMIDRHRYIKTVKSYFEFLTSDFNFKLHEEEVRGNAFYDVEYKDNTRIISISYENIEEYFRVIICILQDGKLPNYDDKTKTLHLGHLNKEILPRINKSEIDLNTEYFTNFNPKEKVEKQLLKAAKELRLCLKHYNEHGKL